MTTDYTTTALEPPRSRHLHTPSQHDGHERAADVGVGERILSVATGGLLFVSGLRAVCRWPISSLLMSSAGGYLAYRGASGRCGMYRAAGATRYPTALSHPFSRDIEIRESIRIAKPARELFDRWRDLERLPEILRHVESVEHVEVREFLWHFRVGKDKHVKSHVLLTEEREGEYMGWVSTEHSDVEHRGSIRFEPATGGRGTIMRLRMTYHPPGGAVRVLIAKMLGRDPARQVRTDLARFEQIMETGEIATNAGTSAHADRRRPEHAEPVTQGARTDVVTESSEDSFPASDPPAWTMGRS